MQSTRFRLDISYDGTAFFGWARQPALRTVQGVLDDALATLFRLPPVPDLTVAGRTDSGVHATGQVAHCDVTDEQVATIVSRGQKKSPPASDAATLLARRLNGILSQSSDVVVKRVSIAPRGFDARFSAIYRRYRYRIADALSERDPLRRLTTAWYPTALDIGDMNRAAESLLGVHDFAAFCKPRDRSTTIRHLKEFHWLRKADGVLVARVESDAFCHSMARALVGACVAVGEGRLGWARIARLRDEKVRTSEFTVMPARGLTLVEVGYPADELLADRALQTRARRDSLTGC